MKLGSETKRKARIEIIPLIDIIFFLLATFVMVSLSMVKNQGISVNAPSAKSATKQTSSSDYTAISITANGDIYFNKEKVTIDQLRERLFELKNQKKDPLVMVNGDDKASLGQAVIVMDEIRKAGINQIAIEAKN